MGNEKYVAYVSTYTAGKGDNHGIKIYDVDVENGRLTEKNQVEITNSSYVTISHSMKCLYSITDFGVESYRILENGDLEMINFGSINGMRGCYLSTDYEDKFLFVAGYFTFRFVSGKKCMKTFEKSILPPVEWLGKHSFGIYMVHQPVIYAILEIVFRARDLM